MFNGKTRIRNAAIMLVVLQSVASYGYAQTHDRDEYVEVLELHADPTVARGADIEATITGLNVERMARLHERIRLSTRALLAAAAPTDDAATKPIQAIRGSWTRSWVTFSCLRHLIQPQTPFFDH